MIGLRHFGPALREVPLDLQNLQVRYARHTANTLLRRAKAILLMVTGVLTVACSPTVSLQLGGSENKTNQGNSSNSKNENQVVTTNEKELHQQIGDLQSRIKELERQVQSRPTDPQESKGQQARIQAETQIGPSPHPHRTRYPKTSDPAGYCCSHQQGSQAYSEPLKGTEVSRRAPLTGSNADNKPSVIWPENAVGEYAAPSSRVIARPQARQPNNDDDRPKKGKPGILRRIGRAFKKVGHAIW
jgi:TolA-binding protein